MPAGSTSSSSRNRRITTCIVRIGSAQKIRRLVEAGLGLKRLKFKFWICLQNELFIIKIRRDFTSKKKNKKKFKNYLPCSPVMLGIAVVLQPDVIHHSVRTKFRLVLEDAVRRNISVEPSWIWFCCEILNRYVKRLNVNEILNDNYLLNRWSIET